MCGLSLAITSLPQRRTHPALMHCTLARLPATQLEAAAACEAADVPLYLAESNGWLAAFFTWLGSHDFAVPAVGPSVPYSIAIAQHWDAGTRKVQAERAELYLAMREMWKAGPAPGAAVVTQAAQAAAVSAGIDAAIIQPSTVDVLCRTYQHSMPAVDTVVAGLLAQEISNAISRTRQPICNWLVYNGWDGEARAWHSAAFKPKPIALAAPVPEPVIGDDSDSDIVAIVDDAGADVVDILNDDSD